MTSIVKKNYILLVWSVLLSSLILDFLLVWVDQPDAICHMIKVKNKQLQLLFFRIATKSCHIRKVVNCNTSVTYATENFELLQNCNVTFGKFTRKKKLLTALSAKKVLQENMTCRFTKRFVQSNLKPLPQMP